VDSVLEEKVGFVITRSEYIRGYMSFFRITGTSIRTDGKKMMKCTETYSISAYKGVKKLNDLPVKLLGDQVAKELSERGKTFRKVSQIIIANFYIWESKEIVLESTPLATFTCT